MKLQKFLTLPNATLALIILAAFMLRVQGVLNNTFAFTYDVGRDILAAGDIVENFNIILIGPTTGLHGLFYGPWWYYFLTIPYVLGDGDPRAAILTIATTGVVTVIFAFLLGKRLGDVKLGLIFSSFVAFSHVMVGFTAQLWNPNIAPLILIGILLTLEYFANTKKRTSKKDTVLSVLLGFLVGLSFDAEVVYGTLLFVSLFLTYTLLFKRYFGPKMLVLSIIGGTLAFLPRIIFELKNNFLMTRNVIEYLSSGESAGSIEYTRGMLDQLVNRVEAFFFLFRDTVAGGSNEIGIILLIIFTFTFIFSYKRLDRRLQLFTKISGIILLTFFVGLLFLKEEVYGHYVVGLPLIILFLLSISICEFAKKKIFYLITLSLAFSLVMLRPQSLLSDSTTSLKGDPSVYKNYLSVIDYVYEQADGEKFNYDLYTPPVHDNTYRYLFEWYGERRHGYSPSTDTQELHFLIIEPDRQYPFRIDEWLEVREGSGEVIKTEKLNGDITVQTRRR